MTPLPGLGFGTSDPVDDRVGFTASSAVALATTSAARSSLGRQVEQAGRTRRPNTQAEHAGRTRRPDTQAED